MPVRCCAVSHRKPGLLPPMSCAATRSASATDFHRMDVGGDRIDDRRDRRFREVVAEFVEFDVVRIGNGGRGVFSGRNRYQGIRGAVDHQRRCRYVWRAQHAGRRRQRWPRIDALHRGAETHARWRARQSAPCRSPGSRSVGPANTLAARMPCATAVSTLSSVSDMAAAMASSLGPGSAGLPVEDMIEVRL